MNENSDDISFELEQEWIMFCKNEYETWKKLNPPSPIFLNNPSWQFEREYERSKKWKDHIRKLGDNWWKFCGYQTEWPDDSKLPLKVIKVQT